MYDSVGFKNIHNVAQPSPLIPYFYHPKKKLLPGSSRSPSLLPPAPGNH